MKLRTILLILVFLSLASISTGGYLYYVSMKESSLERAHQEGTTRTQLIADHIDSFLSERQKTVKAFAGLKELRRALVNRNESKILEANMILDHFQQALNVDVCYLMDEQGNTVASSNRNAPDSFVGKNYAFRPYFQEAKQGNPAIYMALGATSGKRGVYFSHPVYGEPNKLPSGVVVVKDSNQATEKEISRGFEGVMLFTDPHGVIFVSSRESWLFQVLWRVLPDEITKIVKTRQFGDGPLKWTGLERESETHAIDKSGIEYDIHQTEIKNYPGWKVVYLNDSRAMMNRVSGPLFKTAGLIILISCLIVGLAVLFLYRGAANVIVLRKKADKERQKEKEFSDSLVNSLPGVFYLFDEKKLRFHRWNHNFENVTGYLSSELAGMSPLELFDEYEGVRVAERIGQVFEKGYATVEAVLLTKNGDRIPYFFTGHALKTDEETYLIGMGLDVSERKQAEEALRESEEKYRTILENIEDGYFEVDIAGYFTFFNDSMCKIIGYSKDELIGMNNRQYMDEESAKKVFQNFNYVYRTEKPIKGIDWKLIRKDGSDCFVETSVSLIKDSKDHPAGFRGIARDVSSRKEMENFLRENKDNLDKAQEIAHVGSWRRDLRKDQGYWSDEMYRILGLTPGEPQNPSREYFLSRVHPADREHTASILKEAVEKKDPFDFEFRTIPIEGKERIIHSQGEVTSDETGTPVFLLGTNRDMTERRRLQDQLQQAQKMDAISILAGGVAHEFNNALMGIMGNIELLKMDLPEDEGRDRYFQAMRGSGHRMSRLTDQLLAYAQGGKYQPKNLKLDEFVLQTVPILQHDLSPQVRVETHFPKDISYIKADYAQMQMVLSAILANSNEAMEDEGLIRITAENKDVDADFTKQHPGLKPGPYVCLTIEDDGKGMDEETRSGIFEPFFTTKFQGRGMGMAAVYGIVKNHDGWIYLDSELGKGTVVQIYFPAIETKLKKPKTTEVEIATGSGTILMIEDEDVVLEVTQAMLESLGYRVMVAKTGKEAIHITETFDGQIDLALLDIKLPDMEGGKVYPLIMEARPDLKVIVFSGYSIDGPARKILDAGAQDFIQKPFSLATLSQKLKEVLGGNNL